MSSAYLCRQPIFDRGKAVYGYKLLHRTPLNGTLSVAGLSDLAAKKTAFIKITRKLLVDGEYGALPTNDTVIELLEAVEPDGQEIAACKSLKSAGYTLALTAFATDDEYRSLLELADILKVDFLASDAETRKRVAGIFAGKDLKLLAERVETHEDFRQALELGYTYFQGYFFCKPQVCELADLPAYKQNYLRFIAGVNAPELNYDHLESAVKADMSLSTRLLRFLNSSSMGIANKITSIKQALTMLGKKPLRKWATLAALLALGDDKPTELIVTALIRARFCELVGAHADLSGEDLELFIMGLFSAVDALVDQPMSQLLSKVPLPPDVAAALLGADNPVGRVYALALALERGRGPRVEQVAAKLRVETDVVTDCYRQAVVWADQNTAA